jgi:hypothetical protein
MSKILVVQPYKMLQQAIALFLFPQHQARMTNSIPDSSEIRDVDAAIIDAAALRETEKLSSQAIRSLEEWKIPIVWIDTVKSPLAPSNDNLVWVNTPIAKQSLQSALTQCLGELPRSARKKTRPTSREKLSSRDAANCGNPLNREVIDLVEVVEEPPKNREDNDHEQL